MKRIHEHPVWAAIIVGAGEEALRCFEDPELKTQAEPLTAKQRKAVEIAGRLAAGFAMRSLAGCAPHEARDRLLQLIAEDSRLAIDVGALGEPEIRVFKG